MSCYKLLLCSYIFCITQLTWGLGRWVLTASIGKLICSILQPYATGVSLISECNGTSKYGNSSTKAKKKHQNIKFKIHHHYSLSLKFFTTTHLHFYLRNMLTNTGEPLDDWPLERLSVFPTPLWPVPIGPPDLHRTLLSDNDMRTCPCRGIRTAQGSRV